jgi:hypothetical protein
MGFERSWCSGTKQEIGNGHEPVCAVSLSLIQDAVSLSAFGPAPGQPQPKYQASSGLKHAAKTAAPNPSQAAISR